MRRSDRGKQQLKCSVALEFDRKFPNLAGYKYHVIPASGSVPEAHHLRQTEDDYPVAMYMNQCSSSI
jgi:hypothetical protein